MPRILPAVLAAALALAACFHAGPNAPEPSGGRGTLTTDPNGTVDTTHGASGAQTTPH
jgi:hypothetical protein